MPTERELFRAFFLLKAARAGTSPEILLRQVRALRLRCKAATDGVTLGAVATPLLAGLANGVKTLGNYATPIAIGAPIVAGGLAGAGLAQLQDVDSDSIKALQKREIIAEYVRNRKILERQRRDAIKKK